MKRIWLLLLLCGGLARGALTTITQTLVNADGTNPTGSCVISWPYFTSVTSAGVAANRKTITVAAGAVSTTLEPNDHTSTVYTVVCTWSTGRVVTEYWRVGTSTPTTVVAVRLAVPPQPSITVTKGQMPAATAYEDEANIFTAAGGVTLANQMELRLREATGYGTNYIGIRAPAALASNFTLTMAALAAGYFKIDGSGNVSWAFPPFSEITGIAVPGQYSQTVRAQTGTSDTMLDSDRGKLVTHTNGSAIAVTLPQAGAGSAFISGWFVDVQNRGAGTATVTPTTSTIDGAASLALTTGQGVRIVSDGTNYFTQRGIGGGITTLNGLTPATQTLAVGTSGTDFAISSATSTHTFNLPTASASNRGALSTTDWTTFNDKLTSPLTTRGDVLTRDASTHVRLALGTAKKVLTSDGTDPLYQFPRARSHVTDCTSLTDGKEGEICYEQDADTVYVCEPTAGDCDTAAEWRQVTGASATGYQTVQDETTSLAQRNTIDFAGAGVTCADSGGTKTLCTIPGGGGGALTHRISLLNSNVQPDSSGSVFSELYTVKATNDFWRHAVWVFNDTATKDCLYGSSLVPNDYSGSAVAYVFWTSTAITGNAIWDWEYRTVGGDDTTSLDQATAEESLTVTDAAPTATDRRMTASMSITSANLAASETLQWRLCRDGVSADTIAAALTVHDVVLQYVTP